MSLDVYICTGKDCQVRHRCKRYLDGQNADFQSAEKVTFHHVGSRLCQDNEYSSFIHQNQQEMFAEDKNK